MKKILSLFLLISFSVQNIYAKKVKIVVDMTGQTKSANGIHVMGDFQSVAGLGADWSPNTALMTQNPNDTNLYFLYTDIPAFQKYEYKFVNGDQSYEVEVVPDVAQVGYNFVDNRWIYIDSIANDTTLFPAVIFNQSSPNGKTLLRFLVDMTLQTVSPNGVHVAGNFQGWNTNLNRLYSFGSNVYETIVYEDINNNYDYKFYNGNTPAATETVPNPCATNNNRRMMLTADTILQNVCFSSCSTCYPTSISQIDKKEQVHIYPNPANEILNIQFENRNQEPYDIIIKDVIGKTIKSRENITENTCKISMLEIEPSFYFIQIKQANRIVQTQKILIQ